MGLTAYKTLDRAESDSCPTPTAVVTLPWKWTRKTQETLWITVTATNEWFWELQKRNYSTWTFASKCEFKLNQCDWAIYVVNKIRCNWSRHVSQHWPRCWRQSSHLQGRDACHNTRCHYGAVHYWELSRDSSDARHDALARAYWRLRLDAGLGVDRVWKCRSE